MVMADKSYDLVVVGAGIIGLATAWTARQRGLRVALVERNAKCIGASVRNFGFITVTGQRAGEHWRRARRTRDLWQRIAPLAGIKVIHQGLNVLAQRPEAADVLEAFLKTEMGEGCRLLSSEAAARELSELQTGRAVLYSPHELRVESRDAIPRLAEWLEHEQGVDFFWNTPVLGVDLPNVHTSQGALRTSLCVICPGHDLRTLYPDVMAQAGIQLCTLQMLRVKPVQSVWLSSAVMSDLSLVRNDGFADLPEAAPLKALLQAQQSEHLEQGVHLIAVQSADGSLVVGDSHLYGDAESPFGRSEVDELILGEMHRVLRLPGIEVTERWTGTYASAKEPVYKKLLVPGVVLGVVTGGTGASTSFALAEELLDLAQNL